MVDKTWGDMIEPARAAVDLLLYQNSYQVHIYIYRTRDMRLV